MCFVPLVWVAQRLNPRFTMVKFSLRKEALPLRRERWDLVNDYWCGKESVISWANGLPLEAIWP